MLLLPSKYFLTLKVCVCCNAMMLVPLGTSVLTQKPLLWRGVFTPRAPWGVVTGCTVPCTIDILVAFGRDLLPLLPEAPMQWFTCGRGIPFVAAGDLPKPHYSHQSNTDTSREAYNHSDLPTSHFVGILNFIPTVFKFKFRATKS